jgi:hypothetical protein
MEKHSRKHFSLSCNNTSLYLLFFMYFAGVEGISLSIKGKFLLGYEIGGSFKADWLGCLMSCQKDNECVSYNFRTKTNSCQLNSHGIEHGCMADKVLTTGRSYVFHQIKVCVRTLYVLILKNTSQLSHKD